jgi:hypothetical protein
MREFRLAVNSRVFEVRLARQHRPEAADPRVESG